jgi:hypothetical protein
MKRTMSPSIRNWLVPLCLVFCGAPACDVASPAQLAQYESDVPKTILELQPFRRSTSHPVTDAGGRRGTATLVELNPNINSWFLLQLLWEDPGELRTYHLENPDARGTRIALDPAGQGLRITSSSHALECILWAYRAAAPLEEARRSGLPYAPLCEGRLYLRNPVAGTYTRLESVTNFLRDHVWGGDRIVNFVKEEFFRDRFAEKGAAASGLTANEAAARSEREPLAARLDSDTAGEAIVPEHLGLDVIAGRSAVGRSGDQSLTLGTWYAINHAAGIYVSAIRPQFVADDILRGFRSRVSGLDAVEANAVDYLVAFDLAQFDLAFALGTDHPRVDWSGRERPEMLDGHLPGPDGIATSAPLVRNGMVSPALAARTAGTFAGGFKREHDAFRYGDLALQNHGSHYGFIEQGAIFSKLQPGLATVYVLDDGSVNMKTWTRADDSLLPRLRYARQNGVPLLEHNSPSTPGSGAAAAAEGVGIPGPLVAQWGAGNWSGSADEKLRTLRSGVCIQPTGTRRFLIYGYFSTATPSAMTRVFQAYSCQYAMHLDMNALEHTYLALYTHEEGKLLVQHLIEGMSEVDRKGGGAQLAPRFLGFPDDRDFFYLVRRPAIATR